MFPDFFASFFSSYILLSITVLIVLLGAIYLYINTRMAEQDHKLSSMVNVIQGIMQDTQIIKSQLMHYASSGGGNSSSVCEMPSHAGPNSHFNKITVSDNGDDDSESEYETDSESDSDSDSNDEGIQYVEGEVVDLVVEDPVIEEDSVIEDADVVNDVELDEVELDIEPNVVELAEDDSLMVETKASSDLKKMTVGALRAMATEKGVCDDASKLKKMELIDLLV